MEGILFQLLLLVFVIVVLGAIDWLIQKAPFLSGEFKSIIRWVLIVVGVIVVIVIVAGWLGIGPGLRLG